MKIRRPLPYPPLTRLCAVTGTLALILFSQEVLLHTSPANRSLEGRLEEGAKEVAANATPGSHRAATPSHEAREADGGR